MSAGARLRRGLRGAEQRLYRRLRSRAAASAGAQPETAWSAGSLARHSFCLIVSRRRDGRAVPTPVWFAIEGDRIVFRSAAGDGKVKRIRRRPDVLVCPCSFRGRPLGAPMPGRARLLEPSEWPAAETALRTRYGLGRRIYTLLRDPLLDRAYLEVTRR